MKETTDHSATSDSEPWYVCMSKPRREIYAAGRLQEQAYEIYLPMLTLWTRKQGRWEKTEQVMFPRYLFVRCYSHEQSIGPIRSTPGVTGLVLFGMIPATLNVTAVEAIRALERARATNPDDLQSPFKVGASVVIADGPLKGLGGIVSRVARERVEVLMTLMGREQRVAVPTNQLVESV